MCMTAYLTERANEFEKDARAKIELLDILIADLCATHARAACLPRAAGLVAMLSAMRAEAIQQREVAQSIINDAALLRRRTIEVDHVKV